MMFARKRRTTTRSKHFISRKQDSFNNTQNCEPLNHTNNCNYEVKSTECSNFKEKFELSLADIKNWESFIHFMYRPMDPASLGLVRIMFGFIMVLDIPEERGLADADINWGDPNECRFPLFNFLQPLTLQWMCIIYLIMWIGALGIMLGLFYRISCFAFVIPYWYIFLLDKTSWNNHSYLYGVISILLLGSQANRYASLDILLGKVKRNSPVPLWNYFILRFQIFLLYFFAGLKKMDKDWLDGYSMRNLGNHWIFEPFKLLLAVLDVWCSLNGRFQQRMFDPRVDLLTAEWSPLKEVSWLMPLLTEFSSWRKQMMELEKEVYSWSEYSDVIFVADFPGLTLENYISEDLANITLTVLEGDVIVEIAEDETVQPTTNMQENISRHRITKDESVGIPARVFHMVHTVSETPACYMYSYINRTRQLQEQEASGTPQTTEVGQKNTGLWNEFVFRLQNIARAIGLVSNALLNVLYSVPMVKRVRVA